MIQILGQLIQLWNQIHFTIQNTGDALSVGIPTIGGDDPEFHSNNFSTASVAASGIQHL
jgi:hypothetical protein